MRLPIGLPELPFPNAPPGEGDGLQLRVLPTTHGWIGKLIETSYPFRNVDSFVNHDVVELIHDVALNYPQASFDPDDDHGSSDGEA